MAYTDGTLNSSVTIKRTHVSELANEVNTIISNAKLTSAISTGTMDYSTINKNNITNLQKAINALEGSFSNNCCESNHCQTCQSDRCQSCQGCQNACTCQSSRCQSCQSCQKNCSCESECRNCSSCFISGTKVLMANGVWKPIETIQIGEYVQGPAGVNKVIGTQYTHLGNRRCIWTFSDRSIYFSGEHLFWVRKQETEFFGVADMTQHILEKDVVLCPQYKGLTLSQDVLVIDRPVDYAVIDGWKHDEPMIAREYGTDTELYELVIDGSHMMFANGYLVAANAHDDDFDYSTICWNGLKNTGNKNGVM